MEPKNTPIENTKVIPAERMVFNITHPNHLVISVLHLPIGEVEIESKMTVRDKDGKIIKQSKVAHIIIEGTREKIIEKLMIGSARVLVSGQQNNISKEVPKEESRIIVP